VTFLFPDGQVKPQALAAVQQEIGNADILLMAAAVADFHPRQASEQKIKKNSRLQEIPLEPTRDILECIGEIRQKTGFPRRVVGFAAETESVLENARQKLTAKKLDLIVANDVSAPDSGFSVDTNRVTFLFPDGQVKPQALATKYEVAEAIMKIVVEWLQD